MKNGMELVGADELVGTAAIVFGEFENGENGKDAGVLVLANYVALHDLSIQMNQKYLMR
jgi:hypothetical protein